MKEFWNERYGAKEFAYGKEANVFFAEQLVKIKAGKLLLAAEGEGRNAVFAADHGWDVLAFDSSSEAKKKAEKLALDKGVKIEYQLAELSEMNLPENYFDVIGLIYAHFPAAIKSDYHKRLDRSLKIGGYILFEAFSKKQLTFNKRNEKPMGPQNLEMLFSIEEIKNDFPNYEILILKEEEVNLSEGLYHKGIASVIRFIGRKK